jgi:ribosomal protein S18 acetylase RimI-like enzyme
LDFELLLLIFFGREGKKYISQIMIELLDASSSKLTFRVATEADAEKVMALTNEAFVADTFFKKPKYHDRFDLETVLGLINKDNSAFLLAESSEGGELRLVGSLYLHWEIIESGSKREVVGKFSAVSVPPRFGRQGIGKALVDETETKIREIARSLEPVPDVETTATLQMGVINQRYDLFPWYQKQGFQITGEIRGDPEIDLITLEEMKDDIYLVLMSKPVSLY